jgi:hypothetical protein
MNRLINLDMMFVARFAQKSKTKKTQGARKREYTIHAKRVL